MSTKGIDHNGRLDLFNQSCLLLAKSLVFYNESIIRSYDRLEYTERLVFEDSLYHTHLQGIYTPGYDILSVYSEESNEEIPFTTESLQEHTLTLEVYQEMGDEYNELIVANPYHALLIRGILFPMTRTDYDELDEGSVLSYNPALLSDNEVSLIKHLESISSNFIKTKINDNYHAVDVMYRAGYNAVLTGHILTNIKRYRLSKVNSPEINTHLLYLGLLSKGLTEKDLSVLTLKQLYWLYKHYDSYRDSILTNDKLEDIQSGLLEGFTLNNIFHQKVLVNDEIVSRYITYDITELPQNSISTVGTGLITQARGNIEQQDAEILDDNILENNISVFKTPFMLLTKASSSNVFFKESFKNDMIGYWALSGFCDYNVVIDYADITYNVKPEVAYVYLILLKQLKAGETIVPTSVTMQNTFDLNSPVLSNAQHLNNIDYTQRNPQIIHSADDAYDVYLTVKSNFENIYAYYGSLIDPVMRDSVLLMLRSYMRRSTKTIDNSGLSITSWFALYGLPEPDLDDIDDLIDTVMEEFITTPSYFEDVDVVPIITKLLENVTPHNVTIVSGGANKLSTIETILPTITLT